MGLRPNIYILELVLSEGIGGRLGLPSAPILNLMKIYLYGVSLVVVVGEVEELEVERGPQPLHHLRVQPPHGHVAVAEGK